MASAPCCPPDSWPAMEADEKYQEKGVTDELGDGMKIYRVGEGDKCIIWAYHIFGFKAGHQVQIVDQLAERGYMVLIPDWFRGRGFDPKVDPSSFVRETSQWSGLDKDWQERVLPYAKENGAKVFGAMGTCWGSYLVMKLCHIYHSLFRAGVSFHPATGNIAQALGESEREIYFGVKGGGLPQLFLPAGNDSPTVKKGGMASQVLSDKLEIVEYPDMIHGWTVRGDLKDEKVAKDTYDALQRGFAFMDGHMKK